MLWCLPLKTFANVSSLVKPQVTPSLNAGVPVIYIQEHSNADFPHCFINSINRPVMYNAYTTF